MVFDRKTYMKEYMQKKGKQNNFVKRKNEVLKKNCINCGNEFKREKWHSYLDFENRKFCSKQCRNIHLKNNSKSDFDRKAYMKEYLRGYRKKQEVKDKRLIESKKNYDRQKRKKEILRKIEISKSREITDKLIEPYKYIRKNTEKYKSQRPKGIKLRHSINLLDSSDYIVLKYLMININYSTIELNSLLGFALSNFVVRAKRLKALHLIDYKLDETNKKRKIWNITEFGKNFLTETDQDIRNFIIYTKEKKNKSIENKSMMMELLTKC